MITAYVLIIAKSGAEKKVVEELGLYKEIEDAEILYGEYDILAKIKVKEISDLNEFLLSKVRRIDGVEKTSTLISAK
ncbi:MAG: Lrp/AsnC ligand binding domain-containing protein [DPANN group archaeon]|nr:Lrp/AsnC ligand binding domain-containing protein [DPANN group archaeon]